MPTDRHDELAREWLDERGIRGGLYTPALLSALLRQVARETLLDAADNPANQPGRFVGGAADGARHVLDWLRARAKELE